MREVLFFAQDAESLARPASDLGGVAAHECRSADRSLVADDREIQREVVALDAPAPWLLGTECFRVAEDVEEVKLRVADGASSFLDRRQDLLQADDRFRLHEAALAQAAGEQGVRQGFLFTRHFLQGQALSRPGYEVPVEAERVLEIEGDLLLLIWSERRPQVPGRAGHLAGGFRGRCFVRVGSEAVVGGGEGSNNRRSLRSRGRVRGRSVWRVTSRMFLVRVGCRTSSSLMIPHWRMKSSCWRTILRRGAWENSGTCDGLGDSTKSKLACERGGGMGRCEVSAISARAAALASFVINSVRTSMMRTALAIAAVSIAIGLGYEANIARSNSSASPTATGNVQQQGADEPDRDRTIRIQALSNADGSPLPGATVWVRAVGGRIHTREGTTDEHGRYELALPGPATTRVDVVVAHAGYVVSGAFGGLKAEYSIPLERSEAIGGIVRDEAGRPIEGARVLASYFYEPDLLWPEVYRSLNSSLAVATTDAQGRWRADALPEHAGLNAALMVLATHPDHIATRLQTTAGKVLASPIEQVMKTGVSVSGTVLSPFGRPVPEAMVVITVPPLERMFLRLTTDSNGQFHSGRCFDPIRTKPYMTVLASGLAMAAQEIVLRQDAPAQVVQLSRRRPIEGRVVDAQGRPVAGAAVAPAQSVFKGMLDWDAKTGLDGRFVWHDAPAIGTILLDVFKPNYRPVRERAVDREADELVIALHHPQRLHGKVTDAETGRPVEQFTLIHGSGPSLPGMRPAWNRDDTRRGAGGRFDLSYATARDKNSRQSIRIEADGYKPVEFLGFPADAEVVERDFKLHKATPFSGIVRGPDGQPLDNANLVLADSGSSVPLYYYWVHTPLNVFPPTPITTGGSGRYSFPTRDQKTWIVAAHKVGFALRSPEQLAISSDFTLVPWGRVEGVVKVSNKTAPSQRVGARLFGRQFNAVVEHTTRTDKDGRFKIDFVAPGVLTVGRQVRDVLGSGYTLSNLVEVEVAPGQTIHVEIGGKGRPVIGRFALPGGTAVLDLASSQVRLRSEPPVLRMPDGFIDFTDEQWSAWWEGFQVSPEGRAYLAGDRQFAVALNPNGAFRVEDVPAGRYVLKLTYRGDVGDGSSGRLAVARAEVEVPEIPGGRSDTPLDIGTIPLHAFPFRELNVGYRVPDVIPNAGAGGALDLGAIRGKVVLLAFWSTRWSMSSLAPLKATYDAFGRDPNFVMIGLNADFAPRR